jgi:hypothetical protein
MPVNLKIGTQMTADKTIQFVAGCRKNPFAVSPLQSLTLLNFYFLLLN